MSKIAPPKIECLYTIIEQDWRCLSDKMLRRIKHCELPLANWIFQKQKLPERPLLLGINGPQGSGKSTTCESLKVILECYYGLRVVEISIDDFYLTKQERNELGRKKHSMLSTRGVPGTHDVDLAILILNQLMNSESSNDVLVPRFNKANDDRYASDQWSLVNKPIDVILFEGWCVGAQPVAQSELTSPINKLEEVEDSTGDWRRFVNDALAGDYQKLFGMLDALVLFQCDDFSRVYEWRKQQEITNKQLAVSKGLSTAEIMDDAALERFILHYERVTRSCQFSLPAVADVIIPINQYREVTELKWRSKSR